jgi:hypothetical protein
MWSRPVLAHEAWEEIDFVLVRAREAPIAIECKRSVADFEPRSLALFRQLYPGEPNLLVAMDMQRPYERRFGEVVVQVVGLRHLVERLFPSRAVAGRDQSRGRRRRQ